MTDDEIEEKLRSLSPSQLSNLLGELSGSDSLKEKQRQEVLEIQATLKEESKQKNEATKNSLRKNGPQIVNMIAKSLKEDNLTTEERQQLEKTADMLSGYLMSFWFPINLIGKVSMCLFFTVGVIGFIQWSPWFGLFILLACSCSPRIVGEFLLFIGKIKK